MYQQKSSVKWETINKLIAFSGYYKVKQVKSVK